MFTSFKVYRFLINNFNSLRPNNLAIIVSDNGLSPCRCQAIIWTNAGLLLIGPSGTNFSKNINSYIFIQENAFVNFVCKIAATLSPPQWFNLFTILFLWCPCRGPDQYEYINKHLYHKALNNSKAEWDKRQTLAHWRAYTSSWSHIVRNYHFSELSSHVWYLTHCCIVTPYGLRNFQHQCSQWRTTYSETCL